MYYNYNYSRWCNVFSWPHRIIYSFLILFMDVLRWDRDGTAELLSVAVVLSCFWVGSFVGGDTQDTRVTQVARVSRVAQVAPSARAAQVVRVARAAQTARVAWINRITVRVWWSTGCIMKERFISVSDWVFIFISMLPVTVTPLILFSEIA